jgi:V/A-type H+-transporting ATPase subunit I
MKKVCLMVQDKDKDEALIKLREAGVVHLEKTTTLTDNHSIALEKKVRVEGAIGLIHHLKMPKPPKQAQQTEQRGLPRERRAKPIGLRRGRRATDIFGTEDQEFYSVGAVKAPVRPYLPDLMMDMSRERKSLQDRDTFLNREKSRIANWGEFDPSSVTELNSLGLNVFLYEIAPECLAEIPEDVRYIMAGRDKASVRLLVFDNEIPGMAPFHLPEKSLAGLAAEEKDVKINLDQLEEKIKTFADRRPSLLREMALVQQDIEMEAAAAGMEKIEDVPQDYRFSYLTGYVPQPDMDNLKAAACESGWAMAADDPAEADVVPTKLKNSRFTKLLTPLTDFLEIVPGYREVDISPWFLLFFCIFFGMIFGDAGYGLILMSIALFGIAKTARKGVPLGLKMMLMLSVFNTAWGVFTCSWFGVEVSKVPQMLKDISLSYISTAKTEQGIVDQNLQLFCFSLGLIQMTIAHIKGIIRHIKSLKVFAEIGALAMLWGMYNVILFLVVSNNVRSFPLLDASIYLLAGGFFLTFVFGSYEGSVGQSVLTSVKNIISVVLGVTNVFSDIMSYIRLWAVGLAGASIAATVNTMAGPMLGSFLIFVGVVLLVFGHGLNLILNVLSVLVHGVRLNTLEFSGHVGLTWSGMAYRPFEKKVK